VRSVVIRVANGLGFRVDIVLGPGIDGVTMAERIRARLPALPIVLTSGYSATHFQGRADSIRHHFLPKPFTVDQLRQILSSLLATVQE
jgi:CheY-like chemotaxis protein